MFSIIIPAYNEESKIHEVVCFIKKATQEYDAEIIVVDGGSTDNTVKIAEKAGAKVYKAPQKGRARQMNYGAAQAKGSWLNFLHADTTPPVSFIESLKRVRQSGAKGGCFRLKFDIEHWALKSYAWFTRFDIDLFRFGDQSLLVEKELFVAIGGFDETLIVMEDQEIVRRIKKHARFRVIPDYVTTSGRRYERIGIFKLQVIFAIIVFLFYMGVKQETIVKFYRSQMNSNTY